MVPFSENDRAILNKSSAMFLRYANHGYTPRITGKAWSMRRGADSYRSRLPTCRKDSQQGQSWLPNCKGASIQRRTVCIDVRVRGAIPLALCSIAADSADIQIAMTQAAYGSNRLGKRLAENQMSVSRVCLNPYGTFVLFSLSMKSCRKKTKKKSRRFGQNSCYGRHWQYQDGQGC
jgi:hypothetical protein